MYPIPEAFSCATLAGLWPCEFWSSAKTKTYYERYNIFNILAMSLLIISEVMPIVYVNKNMHELIDSLHLFLTASNACIKAANLLLRREKFIKLANMFLEAECTPVNLREKEICDRYKWHCRLLVFSLPVFGEFVALSYIAKPLFFITDKYTLFFRAWLPYNINSSMTFWPTYLTHAYASHLIAAWNVSIDVLVISFMIQICCQLRLISYRFKSLPEVTRARKWPTKQLARQFEINFIKKCVTHHIYVNEIIKSLKSTFFPSIVSQYCISGFTIALTIYELVTNRKDISTLIVSTIYLTSMILELGLYCWFGNEITLEGLKINDCIRQEDWFELHPRTITSMKIVMLRVSSPIFVTYGPFIKLSNTAYMAILKKSYSSYSVLKNVH